MEIHKIILCTDAPKNQGLAYYYYRAFCDLLTPEKVVIVDEENRNYGASIAHRAIRRIQAELGRLSREKTDRIFTQLQNDVQSVNVVILFNNAGLDAKDIRRLADTRNVYLINLLSDSPYGMVQARQQEVFGTLPFFDLVVIFANALVPVLYQMGAKKVLRVPFGYCKYTHLITEPLASPQFPDKVYYFGTWTPTIEQWLEPLVGHNLVIEGNGWANAASSNLREIGTAHKPNTGRNMSTLARQAGLVVNFTRAPHGCFHTMKTFELPVSGACVLSNYSDEQNEFFPDNEAMVYFNTPAQMVSKVDALFANPERSFEIRRAAIGRAIPHSYHERAQQLLQFLKEEKL